MSDWEKVYCRSWHRDLELSNWERLGYTVVGSVTSSCQIGKVKIYCRWHSDLYLSSWERLIRIVTGTDFELSHRESVRYNVVGTVTSSSETGNGQDIL